MAREYRYNERVKFTKMAPEFLVGQYGTVMGFVELDDPTGPLYIIGTDKPFVDAQRRFAKAIAAADIEIEILVVG